MISGQLIIFLGDIQEYLAETAKAYDPAAQLMHSKNYKQIIDRCTNQPMTVYTSLGDLPRDAGLVYDILKSADIIHYRPPNVWSDHKRADITDPTSSLQGLTETLLLLMPGSVRIEGLVATTPADHDPRPLIDGRKTDGPQIWIVGCSISHGVGVDKQQKYGHLLADSLESPVSFLTRPGSAIDWSADQILRSDIRCDDIVVWGITVWSRITYIADHQLLKGVTARQLHEIPHYKNLIDMDDLTSHQTFYHHYYCIQQVINFCEKVGARLCLAGLLLDNYALLSWLRSQKHYVHIPYQLRSDQKDLALEFEDVGNDYQHPGPKQHLVYKNTLLKFINQTASTNRK